MKLYAALSLLALAAAPAFASTSDRVLLADFEKNWSYGDTVDNTYAANGVTFTNFLGISNDANFTYYSNAPTPLGVAMAQLDFVQNTTAFMNVSTGVDGGLEFYFSTPSAITGAVKAYSGLNGTGQLLGTFDLSANDAGDYSAWTKATFNFQGVAKSFDFTGTANVAGLDNISAVPEPSTLGLAAIGLAMAAVVRRRRA